MSTRLAEVSLLGGFGLDSDCFTFDIMAINDSMAYVWAAFVPLFLLLASTLFHLARTAFIIIRATRGCQPVQSIYFNSQVQAQQAVFQ